MTSIKKIGKVALKTLGWLTFPGLEASIDCDHNDDSFDDLLPKEVLIFLGVTALTAASVTGLTAGYEKIVNKTYSNMSHSINIKVKPNSSTEHNFWYYATSATPLVRLAMIGTSQDITSIKTNSLEAKLEGKNIITFDKEKGFLLNKEAYYNTNFQIKEYNIWIEYNQNDINQITSEYENLVKDGSKTREKAINSGNIGIVTELETKLNKLQNDYEFKRSKIKNTQIRVEKELSSMIDQLNKEYFAYKNTPATTAIPGRDYDLSNITK
jgi:hypothetical protein